MAESIDFYILSERHNRMSFIGRLTEQLQRDQQAIHIHTDDEELAKKIDTALWTARDISFVPHELVGNKDQALVMIGVHDKPEHTNIMINCANEVPEFYNDFKRVVEIIDPDETLKTIGREHYKYYKDKGHSINDHKID